MTTVRHRYAISGQTLVSQRKPDLFITNFLQKPSAVGRVSGFQCRLYSIVQRLPVKKQMVEKKSFLG